MFRICFYIDNWSVPWYCPLDPWLGVGGRLTVLWSECRSVRCRRERERERERGCTLVVSELSSAVEPESVSDKPWVSHRPAVSQQRSRVNVQNILSLSLYKYLQAIVPYLYFKKEQRLFICSFKIIFPNYLLLIFSNSRCAWIQLKVFSGIRVH